MKQLYILRPIPGVAWPEYDANFGFVVRACNEYEARLLAQQEARDEKDVHADAWLNDKVTSCAQLHHVGDSKVILCDFNAG